ncbi:Acetyltransferase (GNAT) family protein [Lentzea albidocapillata subsp. violacea]|uniref:Acetyltransferase (GNAT) family protein n=1 Tax=Lentzea albidocapillata subsp. violacea TaxID=128104 RepID=A0A1G8TLS1_9PSEU|nr:GNAT family N-acetyltransferase [Lentzea albidocapillata]SDJ42344.1 Acetyltransferase (GNAT) family protein [Lentzea albidocapillata subsp. violacea]
MNKHHPYEVRLATHADLPGARSVMLDTFYREFGHGYRPQWHTDVIDLAGAYLDTPRHALFVAVDCDEVVGTTAVRAQGPASPPHPAWIAERYSGDRTAQLFRVYVRAEHRRRGLARELVDAAVRFIAETPGYEQIYLHTDTRVAGAEAFWRSVAVEVCDARDGDPDRHQTVHFEIPVPVLAGAGEAR